MSDDYLLNQTEAPAGSHNPGESYAMCGQGEVSLSLSPLGTVPASIAWGLGFLCKGMAWISATRDQPLARFLGQTGPPS